VLQILTAYREADLGGQESMGNRGERHKGSSKSTTGTVIQLNSNTTVIISNMQATVLRSGKESELYALSQTLMELPF
jgi:hypothetical protein